MTTVLIKTLTSKDELKNRFTSKKNLSRIKIGSAAKVSEVKENVKKKVTNPSLDLLKDIEIPLAIVTPLIETAYRPPFQPWSYYLRSIFHLHNETFNIWTHFLAAVYMIHEVYDIQSQVDFNDPYNWPLLNAMITVFIVYLFSSAAHTFSGRSNFWSRLWFGLDHTSIGIHFMACLICHSTTSQNILHYYIQDIYYQISCLIAFGVAFSMLFGSYNLYIRSVCSALGSILCQGLHAERHVAYIMGETPDDPAMPLYQISTAATIIGFFFYLSHIPERWFPKKFDIYFQSHQFFHIFSSVMCFYNIRGMVVDFETRRHLIERQAPHSLLSLFLPSLIILIFQPASIWYLRHKHKADDKAMKALYQSKSCCS